MREQRELAGVLGELGRLRRAGQRGRPAAAAQVQVRLHGERVDQRGDGAGGARRAEHARQDPRRARPSPRPRSRRARPCRRSRRSPAGRPPSGTARRRAARRRPARSSPSAIWPSPITRRRQQLDGRLGARRQRPRALGGGDQRLEVAGHHVRDRRLEEHRRGAARVARAHALGLAHEPLVRGDRRAAAHLDVAAQALDVGGAAAGRRSARRPRRAGRARARPRRSGSPSPAAASSRRARGSGSGVSWAARPRSRAAVAWAPRPRASSAALLERRGDGLVGRDRARREVPRALGAVGGAAASAACARAGARAATPSGRRSSAAAGGGTRARPRPAPRSAPPRRARGRQREPGVREAAADRVQPPRARRRRDQQRAAGRLRQRLDRGRERALDVRSRAAAGPRAARGPPAGAADSRPGISSSASGLPAAVATAGPRRRARSPRRSSARASSSGSGSTAQPLQPRHLEPRRVVADRADHRHALLPEPPPGEQERLQRRLVEPLRVVDDRPAPAARRRRARAARAARRGR